MRSKIEANKLAFSNIIAEFTRASSLAVSQGKRYIRTNDEEKKWLVEAKILNFVIINPSLKFLDIEFNNCRFIAIIGDLQRANKFDEEILSEISLNGGITTVLIAENYLTLNHRSDLSFYNDILFQHDDTLYEGHDYNDLLPFLHSVALFELPKNSVLLRGHLYRIITYILAIDGRSLVLQFEIATLSLIADMALMSSDKILFELLVNTLLSSNFKHAFLELYRLVERLFPVNYLKELHDQVNTHLSFLEFSASIENITSWRPKEEDAVEKIFMDTKQSVRDTFESVVASQASYRGCPHYRYFYKLRNAIVHFRANHDEMSLDDKNWNLVLLATLELIDQQYSKNKYYL